MPVLTFRTWVLGISASFVINLTITFFGLRKNPIIMSTTLTQILMLPVGRIMASTLSAWEVKIPWIGFSFSLNPGPFNIKEHVLADTLSDGGGYPYSLNIVTLKKVFFKQKINMIPSFMMVISTQLLGYGLAGLFNKLLVQSPYMWWPPTLSTVSMFRALHETEKVKLKGKSSKFQLLIMAGISSFAYYIIPNFFFPSLTALSVVCWIWKRSITAQQIGSGLHGLGLGSFAFDWNSISGFLGSPMSLPLFTIMNTMAGFVLILYIIVPISYWSNLFESKRFPIFSSDVFDYDGQSYNMSRILNPITNQLDVEAYNNYSRLYQSITYVLKSRFGFAAVVATLTHVALFYGRSLWQQFIHAYKNEEGDVHNHLMRKYKTIPLWWYYVMVAISIVLGFVVCEGFGNEFQLPFWGFLLACALVLIFLPALGVIYAISGNRADTHIVEELIISYLYPGRPFANMTFNSYAVMSRSNAFSLLSQLKVGHYMKIPPRSMFIAQIAGTLIGTLICFFFNWWLISSINNICHPEKLPKGSPWTCPGERVRYTNTINWGIIGPQHLYYPYGLYSSIYYFFLIGLIMPTII
ncbi:Oligopeptide transporter OPT protein [Dioscorea alata]|uniref:Oligopeptide transporter OPT protein n=1 Tax=Dioscorea alata TaxID=55571 RepID=A0ACB7VSN5_DIOAL|nr:Oligopeptide transporter OPT protein [Dioscorea alata]